MLHLFKQSAKPVRVRGTPQPEAASAGAVLAGPGSFPPQRDFAPQLQGAFFDILAGKPGRFESLPTGIAGALGQLAHEIARRDEQEIATAVEISVQASDTMAAAARITGDIREIDSNAQIMAAAIEELDASIAQIAETAESSSGEMRQAVDLMNDGTQKVRETAAATSQTADAMETTEQEARQVVDSVSQIATFVSTIEGIAQQTNLLALNTSIEAARAGELGKGFAVVASEVKTLSGQTQTATEDIRALIEGLQAAVGKLLQSVEGAKKSVSIAHDLTGQTERNMGSINDIVGSTSEKMATIAGVLSEQSGATTELSSGVAQIASGSKAAAHQANDVIASLNRSGAFAEQKFADMGDREVQNAVLHRAKSDHFSWKKRLWEMAVGLKTLSSDELSDHRNCRLGKWYVGVRDETLRTHPAFGALEAPHALVHLKGKEAASLFAGGQREGAIAAIEEMEAASLEVVRLLDDLIKR